MEFWEILELENFEYITICIWFCSIFCALLEKAVSNFKKKKSTEKKIPKKKKKKKNQKLFIGVFEWPILALYLNTHRNTYPKLKYADTVNYH